MRMKILRWTDPVFLMGAAADALTVVETAGWIMDDDSDAESIVIASERLTQAGGFVSYRQFTRVPRSIVKARP